MKLTEIHKNIQNMEVDDKTKSAILNIIDNKFENDMDKILHAIDQVKAENKADSRNVKWTITIALAIFSLIIALLVLFK